jgi:hypothetical protein
VGVGPRRLEILVKPGWIALAVAACAVVAVWPALSGGVLTNMDDDVYMMMAEKTGGLSVPGFRWAFGETRPYYHPLPRLSYLATYQFCGTRPAGHHAVNVALHALNSALVVALAWSLSRSAPVSAIAGLLFAIHPLQAESVAWMSGRTQLICGALMIGCALAYVRKPGTLGWPGETHCRHDAARVARARLVSVAPARDGRLATAGARESVDVCDRRGVDAGDVFLCCAG